MATFSSIYFSVGWCSLVSKESLCLSYLGPSTAAPASFWSIWWKSIGKLHYTCVKYEARVYFKKAARKSGLGISDVREWFGEVMETLGNMVK